METLHDDRINVLLCTDANYWKPMAVVIRSIIDSCPNRGLHFFIASPEPLAAGEMYIRERCKEDKQAHFSFTTVDVSPFAQVKLVSDYLAPTTFVRMLAPSFLPEDIDRVLYLDCDIVVLDDLMPLWSLDLAGCLAAVVPEPWTPLQTSHGINYESAFFNAGVILMNLINLRRGPNFTKLCMDLLNGGLGDDQQILNVLLEGQVAFLGQRWNLHSEYRELSAKDVGVSSEEWKEVRRHPAIVHFSGAYKPWRIAQEPHYKKAWMRFQNRMGFSPMEMPGNRPGDSLRHFVRLKSLKAWFRWTFAEHQRAILGRLGLKVGHPVVRPPVPHTTVL